MSFKPFKHPLFDKISTKRFILASTSPRRIEILEQMGFSNVEIIPSNFPEDLHKEGFVPKEVSLMPYHFNTIFCMD
jgi:septum formation protein